MSAIEINNLHKYYGSNKVLRGLSVSIDTGEVVVIVGPSGTGKSTLLRCINQMEPVTKGQIIVNDYDMTSPKTNINLARSKIGMVFQQFNLFPHLTVLENIALAPRAISHVSQKKAETLARQLLAEVGLSDKAHAYPKQLSGGQQQRVAIARALAMKPSVMLFDEPTSALDPEMVEEVLAIIKKLAMKKDMAILIVTHEMTFAHDIGTRMLFLEHGNILADDTPKNLMDHSKNPRIREFFDRS